MQLERELAAAGFILHHVRRHRIYRHEASGRRLVVAAHHGHELSPGDVQAIRRDVARLRADTARGETSRDAQTDEEGG